MKRKALIVIINKRLQRFFLKKAGEDEFTISLRVYPICNAFASGSNQLKSKLTAFSKQFKIFLILRMSISIKSIDAFHGSPV